MHYIYIKPTFFSHFRPSVPSRFQHFPHRHCPSQLFLRLQKIHICMLKTLHKQSFFHTWEHMYARVNGGVNGGSSLQQADSPLFITWPFVYLHIYWLLGVSFCPAREAFIKKYILYIYIYIFWKKYCIISWEYNI